jgi:integrase
MARTKPGSRRRQRTLSDHELKAVWRAAEASPSAFAYFVQFLLLTAVRRSEAVHMSRAELDSDVWTIPQARYKTGLELERSSWMIFRNDVSRVVASIMTACGGFP